MAKTFYAGGARSKKKLRVIVDDIDSDLAEISWSLHSYGYAVRTVKYNDGSGASVYLHRTVLERKLGRNLNPGEKVDHSNRNKRDNRRSNLRLATQSQNIFNGKLRTNNSSGHTGVSWFKRTSSWKVRIVVNYADIHLGYFKNLEDAVDCYRQAAKKYFGQYANNA